MKIKLDLQALNPQNRPVVAAILNAYQKALDRGQNTLYWAWDLHDTILKSSYSSGDIPRSMYPHASDCLQKISKRKDSRLIMYTSSKEDHIEKYKEFFRVNGVLFDFINENPAEPSTAYASFEKKMYFSIVCDDKAGFDPNTDFEAIIDTLEHLPELVGEEKVFDITATVVRMHSPFGPHEGHDALIIAMFTRGNYPQFYLSVDYVVSVRNALTFDDRKYGLQKAIERLGFGGRKYSILPLKNLEYNDQWSKVLDNEILTHSQKPSLSNQAVALLHSRDGFGRHYEPHGRFPVLYIDEIVGVSATNIRKELENKSYTDPNYFIGKVIQQNMQPPLLLIQTRAIIRKVTSGEYLLVKYYGETKPAYRFMGGYFNPEQDKTVEECLYRKMTEKTKGDFPKEMKLLGVTRVNDWRYREAGGVINCLVYRFDHQFTDGQLEKNEMYRKQPRIEEICWVPKDQIAGFLHPEEQPLLQFL